MVNFHADTRHVLRNESFDFSKEFVMDAEG